jgi:hypothetical protein
MVRFSWGPAKKALLEKGVGVVWGDEDDEMARPKRTLNQMFGGASKSTATVPLRKRARFYRKRHMNVVNSFCGDQEE